MPRFSYYRSVTSVLETLALTLEVVTWVGLVPGVVLLAVGYARRAFALRFEHTWGVVVPSPADAREPSVRWMDRQRELHVAPVPEDPDHPVAVGDEVEVYFDRSNPERGRLDDPAHDGRLLRVLGWVLTGIGALAAIAQIVLLFLE